MVLNSSDVVYMVIHNLTQYVWGSDVITSISIVAFFTIIGFFIQIPIPFVFALNIPLCVVLTAYGFLPFYVGGLFTMTFLILAISSFANGIGLNS